ncbi:MAG: OmpA family protein [Gammaproteobacteria bacterium]|nr:OmpA family protein [Gammaproteobacteria bacterium]
MKKSLASMAIAISCLGVTGVRADAGQFYLAPGLQGMNYDNEVGFDNDVGYVIGIGYDFTSKLSAELSVMDLNPQTKAARELDQDLWKVDVFYGLDFDLGKFKPFVVSGLGNSNIDGDNDSIWDIGAGLKLPLNERWTWRTSIRNYYALGRDFEDQDFGIDTTLVYRFGGAAKKAALVKELPQTREPNKPDASTQIADADRDGVPDAQDLCADTPLNYAVDKDGCPIAIEEVARIELLVNFDFDRAEVKEQYLPEIKSVARFMEQYPDRVVELEGHTDSSGTDIYNLGLSQRRAESVMAELVGRYGIAASRVSARGYGESQPVASNDTTQGRADNRRVITVVIKTLQRYQTR